MSEPNQFEVACLEWMRGCSCAPSGKPWQCEECTKAFHDRLVGLRDLVVVSGTRAPEIELPNGYRVRAERAPERDVGNQQCWRGWGIEWYFVGDKLVCSHPFIPREKDDHLSP